MQTQFFSTSTAQGWLHNQLVNLDVIDGSVSIQSEHRYRFYQTIVLQRFLPSNVNVRQVAIDEDNRLYLLDHESNLWVFDYSSGYMERLFIEGHGLFTENAEILCSDGLLVVADASSDASFSAYLTATSQPLWRLSLDVIPMRIAAGNRHFYLVGEKRDDSGQVVLIKVHRNGMIVRELELSTESASVDLTWLLTADDDSVYVMNTEDTHLSQLNHDLELTSTISLSEHGINGKVQLLSVGLQGTLLMNVVPVVEPENASGSPDSTVIVIPVRGGRWQEFRLGRPVNALFSNHQGLFGVFTLKDQQIDMFRHSLHTSVLDMTSRSEGVLYTHCFDSGSNGTIWHRILLDAQVPAECDLRIRYYASDSPMVSTPEGGVNLDDMIAHADSEHRKLWDWFSGLKTDVISGTSDALLNHATGRFIWLQIRFMGTDRETPVLNRLRVYFPRTSLLSYLPAVYQQAGQSADFVTRYLAIFETLVEHLDEEISGVSHMFDVEATPPDVLPWLGTWLGFEFDDTWSSEQIRRVLAQYPQLIRHRGTRYALENLIEIYIGERPLIVEHFEYATKNQQHPALKQLMQQLYGDNPYCFSVLVNVERLSDERQQYVLVKLIEQYKPAFTEAKLVLLSPWIYMDFHTYLGINTVLSEPTELRLDNKAVLPHDTIIIDVDTDARLGFHTRIGLDSNME